MKLLNQTCQTVSTNVDFSATHVVTNDCRALDADMREERSRFDIDDRPSCVPTCSIIGMASSRADWTWLLIELDFATLPKASVRLLADFAELGRVHPGTETPRRSSTARTV